MRHTVTAPPRSARCGRRARGAVLLEALIAAAVVAIALLLVTALLAQEARQIARAAAQRAALPALEGALEAVRAGALPLTSATYTDSAPPWVQLPPARGATLWLEVTAGEVADLWEVRATLRYRAGGDLQTRTLTTRVWRPTGGR